MKISSSIFIKSSQSIEQSPKISLNEFAFIGRSNVGKSSLINMLCEHSGLAKTSATPGKTQLINYFKINNSLYFVDLPGYGYAKTGKENKQKFEILIQDYCTKSKKLKCLFVLIDSRLPLQQIDLEFMTWCSEKEIPFSIIYTKADKNSKRDLEINLKNIETELLKHWEELPNTFISSSEKKTGRKEILEFTSELMK